ncbi:Survival protein SurA precursor (Peptidyl-prolyl cis-trans isomerase SurA) [Candidatus Rhodobacter oscarellae]|uniref:Parvulin-like PPIase n=2 Tax=Candidatus Rhodobacter oscarellae TaxID=1675527 RepID=A0A0J9DZY0_9RHOB|nr:Survival protein SurA precursor (Peptidyl-prolyl cis-trans isomerase SurA) [Candidatus Rhodobacter lobularis]
MAQLRIMILGLLVALAGPALGQSNPFAPAVQVNDRVITQFELDQRILFFEALRAPGDLEQQALDRLVEERLQYDAAQTLGLSIGDEQVQAGMEEFAGRANLTAEQFVAAMGQEGVAEETFRDFVRAGMLWREVVRARFGPRTVVTEAEIDRALELGSATGGVRVLISEIFLPADTPERRAAAQRRAEDLSKITTLGAFASAARQYSAAPSRGRGGRQDWIPVGNLPPAIRAQILTLAPGEVTDPIEVPNAIALFQLRDLEETDAADAEAVSVEFARYFIPGGRSGAALAEADKIMAEVDTCDDLYGVAQGQPEDRLLRDVLPVAEIAGDIAIELAKLDEGEVSTALSTGDGQALVFLMLCGRTLEVNAEANREAVRQSLINQRLASYASGYLSELRADAVIQRLQ